MIINLKLKNLEIFVFQKFKTFENLVLNKYFLLVQRFDLGQAHSTSKTLKKQFSYLFDFGFRAKLNYKK